jgi:hypothetical protein
LAAGPSRTRPPPSGLARVGRCRLGPVPWVLVVLARAWLTELPPTVGGSATHACALIGDSRAGDTGESHTEKLYE